MSELIVLGLIPGTRLQITFVLWILAVMTLVISYLVRVGHRSHLFRDWIITMKLFMLTRQTIES